MGKARSTSDLAEWVVRLAEAVRAGIASGTFPTVEEAARVAGLRPNEALEAVYAPRARSAFHPTRKRKKSAAQAWLLEGRLVLEGAEEAARTVVLEDAVRALRTAKSTCFTLSELVGVVFTRLGSLLKGGPIRVALREGAVPRALGILVRRGAPVLFLRSDVQPVEAEPLPSPVAPVADLAQAVQEELTRFDPGADVRSFERRFEDVFEVLVREGGGRNFVFLADVRAALPDVSREEFDAGLRRLRLADAFTLLGSDGRHRQLTREQLEAGIVEANRRLVYVSRKR